MNTSVTPELKSRVICCDQNSVIQILSEREQMDMKLYSVYVGDEKFPLEHQVVQSSLRNCKGIKVILATHYDDSDTPAFTVAFSDENYGFGFTGRSMLFFENEEEIDEFMKLDTDERLKLFKLD